MSPPHWPLSPPELPLLPPPKSPELLPDPLLEVLPLTKPLLDPDPPEFGQAPLHWKQVGLEQHQP